MSDKHDRAFTSYYSVWRFISRCFRLCFWFLTAITVAAAQVNFGPWNTVIAMGIASIKAGFVLAFFMHLKYDNKIYLVCFGTGVFFLARALLLHLASTFLRGSV